MNENFYRFTALAIFISGAAISVYFRSKADRETGEKISPTAEGLPIMIALRAVGLTLWAEVLAYLINPDWMAWSQLRLPDWLRLIGLGVGVISVALACWVFSNLGNNVSPTVATRSRHQLVTGGPYRWVRHPLYSMGFLSYVSFALLAANWSIAVLAVAVMVVLLLRLPQEEAALLARFGDEYRAYMARTGRFLPKLAGRTRP